MADEMKRGTEPGGSSAGGIATGPAAPAAARNDEFNLVINNTIEADDNFDKPDQSFLDDIARQQAEIIRGFPLVSLTGVADVAKHLSPLNHAPWSVFPHAPPKASTSSGTGAPASTTKHLQDTTRPHMERDPVFKPYIREARLLMGSTKLKDATVSPEDWTRFKTSARNTLEKALFSEADDLADIVWKDTPYGNPPALDDKAPFQPTALKQVRDADISAYKSLAAKFLDDIEVPFPSPASNTPASLQPNPPRLFRPAKGPVDLQNLPEDQKASEESAKAFLRDLIKPELNADGSVKKKKSPIPLISAPTSTSSAAVTPRKPASSSKYLRPDSAPVASTSGSHFSLNTTSHSHSHVFPSPISQVSSSPDPMAIPRSKSAKPTSQGSSSSNCVVEVPIQPKKRPSNLNLQEKTAKRHNSNLKSDPFDTYTSSEMDIDPPNAHHYLQSTSPGESTSPQVEIPARKKGKVDQVQSPSKVTNLKSNAQLQEQQLLDFNTLIEDILDDEESASSKYYIQPSDEPHTGTESDKLLEPSSMRKISKAVRAMVKTTSGKRNFEQNVDVDQMTRLLSILHRSIAAAEDLSIVPSVAKNVKSRSTKSPSKTPQKRKKKASKGDSESPVVNSARRRSNRSSTPASYCEEDDDDRQQRGSEEEEEEYTDDAPETPSSQSRPKLNKRNSSSATKGRKGKKAMDMEEEEEFVWDAESLELLENNLIAVKNAITAIDTVMTILGSASLPKQLYSEDLIKSGFDMLKAQLSSVVYPSLDPDRSPLGPKPLEENIATLIRKILTGASSAFAGIAAFLNQEDATEATVINAVYIAIVPFFSEQGVKGKAKDLSGALEMKVVRSQALGIIRVIFARYPEQRQWIIEEVLSSITKLPDLAKRKPQYMLQNGQAIQAICALLLHIVQSCTSGSRARMLVALKTLNGNVKAEDEEEVEAAELDAAANAVQTAEQLVDPAMDAARQCAGVIVTYIVKRSGKAPKNSTAGEAEYKALLEHLVRDLLVVVDLPEWPAATLMLQIAIKAMISSLDDPKTTADANIAKGISLEHLGTISSKVFKLAQASKLASEAEDRQHCGRLEPLTDVLRKQDRKALKRLAGAEEMFIQQLLDDPADSSDLESAIDFASARWSAEMLQSLRILQNFEEGYKAKFEKELFKRQNNLWQMTPKITLQTSHDDHQNLLRDSLKTLYPVHGLCQSMGPLLSHVLGACEGAVIAFRQKALKALASIVEQDPTIFLQPDVRQAVEKRLMDSSPAVRDAALEMLGRYVVYRPELAQEYLLKIGERINDSGLSVRKRVIKLLKSLYPIIDDPVQRAGICKRLVGRVYDEDENVKELAAAAFEDLYLPSVSTAVRSQRDLNEGQSAITKSREISAKSRILMSVAADFRDRPNPLEDVLRMISEKYTSKKTEKSIEHLASLIRQLKEIVEVLIDNLVDAEQKPDFVSDCPSCVTMLLRLSSLQKLVHCVKTIFILLSPEPSMLEHGRASLLLPYLRNATTVDEQAVVEYLSKIFALILPTLPRSASTFSQKLQDSLRGLLNKPVAIGVQALPDVVSCFCAVVVHQTNDYGKLCSAFQTCYMKLQEGVERLTNEEQPVTPEQKTALLRSMPVLARLVSLFCQFGDFDGLRESSPDAAVFVNAISRHSIQEQVYQQMIQLYHLSAGTALHGTALQCLGFLYRAHPMFMLEEESTTIMDKIFTSSTVEAKALLLRIICDFLVSQTQMGHGDEKSESATDIDMRLLIGNSDNFADSGVSSAIVQRYLHHILDAALTPANSQSLLRSALEAIGFTVRQGLAHPMQCLPVLVALETCTDVSVASKAFALHSLLHEKHSGLINTRLAESIDTTVSYQKKVLVDKPITGFNGVPPSALLCKWYSLMREKRQWRNEFLKAFMRGLHVEPTTSKYTQDQVDVARFTAENLATFDYKSLEEIFFVIRTLTMLLSVAGMQIYHQMQKEERLVMEVDDETDSVTVSGAVVRKSVTLGFAFCLRQHLKILYGINDQKLAKYSIGKKSPAGDKPAVPKGGERTMLEYEGLPFAVKAIETEGDRMEQCQAYIALIDSDGSIREAEGEQDSDEEDEGLQ